MRVKKEEEMEEITEASRMFKFYFKLSRFASKSQDRKRERKI